MESFSTTLGQKAACFRGRTGRPARGEPSRASNRGGPGSPGPWSRRWCSAQMVARAGSLCGSERAPGSRLGSSSGSRSTLLACCMRCLVCTSPAARGYTAACTVDTQHPLWCRPASRYIDNTCTAARTRRVQKIQWCTWPCSGERVQLAMSVETVP